jgi:hypothetical protein
MRSCRLWAWAGWAKCTALAIHGWSVLSRLRSSLHRLLTIRCAFAVSSCALYPDYELSPSLPARLLQWSPRPCLRFCLSQRKTAHGFVLEGSALLQHYQAISTKRKPKKFFEHSPDLVIWIVPSRANCSKGGLRFGAHDRAGLTQSQGGGRRQKNLLLEEASRTARANY